MTPTEGRAGEIDDGAGGLAESAHWWPTGPARRWPLERREWSAGINAIAAYRHLCNGHHQGQGVVIVAVQPVDFAGSRAVGSVTLAADIGRRWSTSG